MESSPSGRFAFAQFVFDTHSGDLFNGARCSRLSRQPALVWRLLIERTGEVVSRDEICQVLWSSDTYIDFDQGINWCVRELRKALGDDAAHRRFVETIAKQGYERERLTAASGKRLTDHSCQSLAAGLNPSHSNGVNVSARIALSRPS
jgi:DNA-binding winged helix-turn-helix (wHTH) protein